MKPIRPKAVYTLGIRGLDDGGIEIEWRLLVEDSCSLFELHIIICVSFVPSLVHRYQD